MHAKALGVIVVYLACLLGMALAAGDSSGAIDDLVLPLHYHHGRSFNHPHAGQVKHQLEERKLPEPYNGPTYRCHDPHPELFVSELLRTRLIHQTCPVSRR